MDAGDVVSGVMIGWSLDGMSIEDGRNLRLRRTEVSFQGKEYGLRLRQLRVIGVFGYRLFKHLLGFRQTTFAHEIPRRRGLSRIEFLLGGEPFIVLTT